MSVQELTFFLHLILAALYLPMIFTLIQRHEGHETAAMVLSGYALIAALLNAAEGLWRSGRLQILSPQAANDIQIYGASVLAFFLILTIVSFLRRNLRAWLIVGAFWAAGFVLIVFNVFGLDEVLWTNGRYSLTLQHLLPTWAMLGWLLFMVGSILTARSAYAHSRQPLLRNRLNYWTPVFLLLALNDALILGGVPLPGNPIRLAAVALATFIVVTHDPPDLVEVSRRIVTYIITTLVIVGFYMAGFSASQTVFNALPNYNPLLVGAGIALLLSLIFTPLLSLVRRWVNRWLNIQEFHPSRTLHAYSEQISNILDMQRLANVAVGLIIEAMDISRGFLFLIDSELTSDAHKAYRLRAVRNQEIGRASCRERV